MANNRPQQDIFMIINRNIYNIQMTFICVDFGYGDFSPTRRSLFCHIFLKSKYTLILFILYMKSCDIILNTFNSYQENKYNIYKTIFINNKITQTV